MFKSRLFRKLTGVVQNSTQEFYEILAEGKELKNMDSVMQFAQVSASPKFGQFEVVTLNNFYNFCIPLSKRHVATGK